MAVSLRTEAIVLRSIRNVEADRILHLYTPDHGPLSAIAKGIQSSDVGLSPNSDGRVIRLNVPPLSTERRKQLVARVKELAEEARVSIRNVRRDSNKHVDAAENACRKRMQGAVRRS